MHARTDARTDGWTENIYSIFRDKLLLLGEHIHSALFQFGFSGSLTVARHFLMMCRLILVPTILYVIPIYIGVLRTIPIFYVGTRRPKPIYIGI
jgi:hypothetical protein